MKVYNGPLAVHHTATVDTPWDGPAAVAAMPNNAATLKYCHAWFDDSGDDTAKSSYKMPHHKADHGPANLAACRNGLARLSGANIPEGDKADVKKHLQAHLDDAAGDEGNLLAQRWKNLRDLNPGNVGDGTWYNILRPKNQPYTAGNAEVFLYDEIGGWGVSAQQFVTEFKQLQGASVDVHINSPGGDVFDGFAIYNAFRAHTGPIQVYVDGLAASAASFIAMAGDRVFAAKASSLMIHDGIAFAFGNAADLRELADLLDKHSDMIAGIYGDKAGGAPSDWRARMQAETWYTSDEALDAGLVDEITRPAKDLQPAPLDNRAVSVLFRYRSRQEAPEPAPVVKDTAVVDDPSDELSDEDWEALKGAFQ